MSSPFIGEIRMFGGNFAPVGWALCDGTTLAISQFAALYQLIGTTYGGDGMNTFNLPDLRGRIPIHAGTQAGVAYVLGQQAGAETVQLTLNQLPNHRHVAAASSVNGNSDNPSGNVPAASPTSLYTPVANQTGTMGASALSSVGSSQPHENMPPFLAVTFIIALEGIFPSTT